MKPPAHRVGLPGNVISLNIVPLEPARSAGLAGHVPARLASFMIYRSNKIILAKAFNTYLLQSIMLIYC